MRKSKPERVLELVQKRGRIPNSELAYYEEVIAVALGIIDNLKPVIHRIPADDLDLVVEAIAQANWIRRRTISQMDSRKENNRQE